MAVAARDLFIVLPRTHEWTLTGEVRDGSSGSPLAGARFQAQRGAAQETSPDGKFRAPLCFLENELSAVKTPLPYAVSRDGYQVHRGRTLLSAGSGSKNLGVIKLYQVSTLSGRVQSEGGRLARGTKVVLFGEGGFVLEETPARDGTLSFKNVRRGIDLWMLASAPGHVPILEALQGELPPIHLVPEDPSALKGVLHLEEAQAAPFSVQREQGGDVLFRGTLENGQVFRGPECASGVYWMTLSIAVDGEPASQERQGTWSFEFLHAAALETEILPPPRTVTTFLDGPQGKTGHAASSGGNAHRALPGRTNGHDRWFQDRTLGTSGRALPGPRGRRTSAHVRQRSRRGQLGELDRIAA